MMLWRYLIQLTYELIRAALVPLFKPEIHDPFDRNTYKIMAIKHKSNEIIFLVLK